MLRQEGLLHEVGNVHAVVEKSNLSEVSTGSRGGHDALDDIRTVLENDGHRDADDGGHDGLTNEAEGDADDQSAERDDATENALRPALNERPDVIKFGTTRGVTTLSLIHI